VFQILLTSCSLWLEPGGSRQKDKDKSPSQGTKGFSHQHLVLHPHTFSTHSPDLQLQLASPCPGSGRPLGPLEPLPSFSPDTHTDFSLLLLYRVYLLQYKPAAVQACCSTTTLQYKPAAVQICRSGGYSLRQHQAEAGARDCVYSGEK
jgi:hypothetical protein